MAGNAQAFEPLVRHYQNAAFATALRYVRSRADAQDIVQDAFVAAYCRLGQLRDREHFGRWLMRIVANRCKDWLRDRRRTQPLDSAETALKNAAAAEHADQMQRLELQEAVDMLPEHYPNGGEVAIPVKMHIAESPRLCSGLRLHQMNSMGGYPTSG